MNTIGYEELLAVGGVTRELGSESGQKAGPNRYAKPE